MLGLAALTVFFSAPGQSYSVTAFVDPMLADLKISRTGYSMAYMVATLIGGCLLPFVGRIVDRLGARLVLPVIALALGMACAWMSQLATVVGLYVGFTLIRCLGQGSLTLISNWIIGEWFQKYRGRAAGLCALGGTASVFVFPQLNGWLIENYGWRQAWGVLGVAVSVCLVAPVVLFLRNRPEPLGLLPDWGVGTRASDGEVAKTQAAPVEQSFTVRQAIRYSSFWKVAAVIATVAFVGTGLTFHQVSILAQHGVSSKTALGALGIQAGFATCSTLAAGFMVDRVAPRFVLAAAMALEAMALLLLVFLPGPQWVYAYAAVMGLHGGIIRSVSSIVWIKYFGRGHQGAVQGISMSLMVIAAAVGPVPVAMVYDSLQTYAPVLWAFLILPVVTGTLVLSAIPPAESSDSSV